MRTKTRWTGAAAALLRWTTGVAAACALTLFAPGQAACQVSAAGPARESAQACAGERVGTLGLTGWDCRGDCTLALDEEGRERAWSFSVEPRISGVVPGGPADGLLQAGDVIVAVDGLLITTKEGGERIVNLPAGADVRIRYRRGSRMAEATLRTDAACRTAWEGPVPPPPPEPPAVAPAPARVVTPRIRSAAPVPPVAPAHPTGVVVAPPSLWASEPEDSRSPPRLGVGFQCTRCGTRADSVAGGEVWFFSQPPEVTAVDEGGAADRAGIQIGDRIVAIDGHAITTEAGGRAFTAVRPGVAVRVTVAKRNGRDETVTLVPERGRPTGASPAPGSGRAAMPTTPRPPMAPEPAAPPAPPAGIEAPKGLALRYSGTMAGVEVEVRGEPVMVSEMRGTRTIVINADGLWIRIRVPGTGER